MSSKSCHVLHVLLVDFLAHMFRACEYSGLFQPHETSKGRIGRRTGKWILHQHLGHLGLNYLTERACSVETSEERPTALSDSTCCWLVFPQQQWILRFQRSHQQWEAAIRDASHLGWCCWCCCSVFHISKQRPVCMSHLMSFHDALYWNRLSESELSHAERRIHQQAAHMCTCKKGYGTCSPSCLVTFGWHVP